MIKRMMSTARSAMSAPISASESPRPPESGGVKAYKGYRAKNDSDMSVMKKVLVRTERTCDVKQERYETRTGIVDAVGWLQSVLVSLVTELSGSLSFREGSV